MRCITFSHASLHPLKEDYRKRQYRNRGEIRTSRDARVQKKEQMAAFRRLQQDETKLRRQGARKVLQEVILRMRRRGVNVGIKCTELGVKLHEGKIGWGNTEDPAPWEYNQVCKTLGYRGCLGKWTRDHGAFWVILLALWKTGHSPSILELGNGWNGVPVKDLHSMWLARSLDTQPFRNLRILRLALTIARGFYPEIRPFEEYGLEYTKEINTFLDHFYHALTEAPHLHTLGIAILPDKLDGVCLGEQVFGDCLFYLEDDGLSNLRHLELERQRINFWELVSFVSARRTTLRTVSLRCIKNKPSAWAIRNQFMDFVETPEASGLLKTQVEQIYGVKMNWEQAYDGEKWKFPDSKVIYV